MNEKQPDSSANRKTVMPHTKAADKKSQSDKFKELARELECDEDEAHWDERLKKVARGKPEKGE
ncbi:hypothetical protein [Croceicoccus naphthovorans]|uniref:hypothetical protein n=1 Tax=Croceicoccus naphthovorans TaxID=1348774 RepID=UPI0012E04D5E|nr:hypothetical protein [Croceicoccus naphthovorans]